MKNYFNQAEMAETTINTGIAKTNNKPLNLFILAIMAGVFIAFAGTGSSMASFNILATPGAYGLGRALLGAYFAAGLMFVIIGGAELFTGNTLIIMAVLEKKTTWAKMFKNWGIVYFGNFIGSVLIAYLVNMTMLFNSDGNGLGGMMIKIATGKIALAFGSALVSGILCNIIVCMAVWMSYAATDIIGKVAIIFFAISLFACAGFEHSIANMFYIPTGIIAMSNPAWAEASGLAAGELANLNWGTFLFNNLLPVTIGNIIGGMVFVGMVYWFVFVKNPKK